MSTKKDQTDARATALPKAVVEHIHQLERIRSDFVANVSHELRTPLTVIRGYLEAIMTRDNISPDEHRKIFEQMYQHSIRMENMIDELLLLSRLESIDKPQDERKAIAISKILETLCNDARRISGEKQHNIILEADKNLRLRGSENELKSLFSNLIINAVKYTPKGGEISIRWYFENDQAVFAVIDTGIGIAEKHLPRLTERFYRVDKARSRESGGTGLGLAIVKHVLMHHDGELNIESKPDVGSTFQCIFPKHRITA